MKYSTIFIAVFLLVGAINALPTQQRSERTTICAKECLNHENNLFKDIGTITSMNYETTSEIELENGQKTQVHLKAKVDIATISKCEHQMTLRKVRIDGPQETETMKMQLERHSTKFAQDNSKIESICFDEDEETWVLNLKKAILSTVQVSVRGGQTEQEIVEKDVLGYTVTKYEQTSPDSIKKTKYLSTSTQRSKSMNSILTGDFSKAKQSVCQIQMDNEKQVLKSVVCEEINSMLPFAHSEASGRLSTVTKMTMDKIERSQPQSMNKLLIRDSLTFNKKHYNRRQGQNLRDVVQAAEQLISEIRSDVEHNIQKETPEKIKKLSQKLAMLNVQELEKLVQQVSNKNDKTQDIFFDTVAQTGTQETAHIILKVILNKQYYNGEVSKMRTAYWLSMLSNVDQVTDEILDMAVEHLRNDNLPRQALFALSNMISEIKHVQEIKQDQRYQQVIEALIQKYNRQTDEKEKIVILKALRNTGVHHQSFDQVFNIAEQKSNHVEIRIAAVQALEQHVTEERFHQKLMKIFENNSNEAELRIAAFQVLANNQKKTLELFNVLKNESDKQVGSYVVSYFKNAKNSKLPEKETLRRIASTFDLPEKRFERSDFRQSKHIQFTQHFEKLDMGAQIEGDLVYDNQKQLRNVRARFDLNKENLQIKSVEITMRQNGLPEVAQQMLQELTRNTNFNAIVDEIKEMSSIRSKHQLNHKINRLFKMLNLNKINLNGIRMTEQMDASISVRVQDKTVWYLNMKDIQEWISANEKSQWNQREQIVNQIFESLTGDHAITMIWSNKQHKMPTHHGLPVHSGYGMVIVAGLKVQDGAFYPSIATDLHYEQGFTITNVSPAVHYHQQLHSAPGWKLELEKKNGVPTKIAISMPENRLEIISAKSMVKLQTPAGEIELNSEKKEISGCTKMFHKILGVEICQQTVYPTNMFTKNAWNFIFNGPMEFGLHLKKTDSSIRKWELIFETPFAQSAGQAKALHLAFNTVGSKANREVSAKIELQNERDSKIVHIDLKTPVKSAKIEARAQWTQQQVGLKAALFMDNQRFEVEIGGEKTNENGEQQYKPSIKLVIPGQRKIHYTGKVALVNSGKKENLHIELKDSTTNQPLIKASFIKSGRIGVSESFKLATDLHAFWFTGSSMRFVSNIQKDANKGFTSDVEIIHSANSHAPIAYKWKVAMKDLSNGQNSIKYNADLELNVPSTQFENVAISWNFANKHNQEVETELVGFWNNQSGQKTRQVHILQQSKMNKISAKISSLNENLLKIEIVPMSVNYEVQAKTNWQRSQQKYNVQLTARDVQTNKQYKGEMSYQMPESRPLKMNLEARIMIEGDEFKITHNLEEQESQQYHGRTMVQARKGKNVELNYIFRMKEHSLHVPTRLHHELDAEIRVPSKSWIVKHKSALKLNSDEFEIKHSLKSNNAVVSDVKISLNKNSQSQFWIDNQMFQIKMEGDLSVQTSQKQINVSVQGKKHQVIHQTKLQWSNEQQIKLDSKTMKGQKQIAAFSIDYLKNQKAEAKFQVEKLGELNARHQNDGKQWATIELKSDYFSRPIRQKFSVEKQSNKYLIKSMDDQNQQIVGEMNLQSDLKSLNVVAFDWQLNGQATGNQLMNLKLENKQMNLKEEIEIELGNKVARIQLIHLNEQKRESKLIGQVSSIEESKFRFENEHGNVEFSIKPNGQSKHIRYAFEDKRNNIQHKSELRHESSTLNAVLEHTKYQQVVVKHETKLSKYEDSYSKTETKNFEIEAFYKRNSAFEFKFSNQNGWKHFTNVEIIDSTNQVARIESVTAKEGEQIMKFKIDVDSLRKIDLHAAHRQNKEMKLRMNFEGQQKHASLQMKCNRLEINSKWDKQSHKDQKYTLEIVDKKHNSNYNLLAHYQRKAMLQIEINGSRNGQKYSSELKLHKNGEALLKVDGKDWKIKNALDFTRNPVQANFEFENRRHSIKHETIATYSQQENEVKIKSKTHKNSQQIANVDFRINPTTKQIFASGEISRKSLKIEGNVNKRYLIELNNLDSSEQFKHTTELDLNARTLHSETQKDGKQLNKIDAGIQNRRDVYGSINVNEHELIFKSNENAKQLELNYNNNKMGIKSTGLYSFDRRSISAKINGHQKSKQVLDFSTNLRMDEKSFDVKLNAFEMRSSAKLQVSEQNQLRANVNYENQESHVGLVSLNVDTINTSEKQISAKIHTKKFKGQAIFQSSGNDEIKIEFVAKNDQEQKIADLKSKIGKYNNKLILNVDFDSHFTTQYSFVSELKNEDSQWVMNSIVKSKDQKVGKLDGKLRVNGLTLDAELNGEIIVNGERSGIIYKLNNLNNKIEHVFKVEKRNYSYGYNVSFELKQGKWIIHLPSRVFEVRYDVKSQTNGHIIVNVDVLPNSEHQPNNIYNIKFDNMITMNHQEMIFNTKTIITHPEIDHPIEIQARTELRQLTHMKPVVVFIAYDASSNQQNRISALIEILNESNQIRVIHLNLSHQNRQILDIHYRWALNSQLIHQQLNWSVLNQQNQKQTGELLAQINLTQRQAKVELNNKHKLQLNWEQNFDKNTIIQVKASLANLDRKMKIMTNHKEQQIEITNFENEKMMSKYIVSFLKAKNTLYAVEMHKKQGSELQKVAFIQLVRDGLNYAKVHMKFEKSLVYEIQKTSDHLKSKAKSVVKRHSEEISSIARQQYQNMKLDEQMENTEKLVNKAGQDLDAIMAEYSNFIQKYLPNVFEAVHQAFGWIDQYMSQVWNLNLAEMIGELVEQIIEQVRVTEIKITQWRDNFDYQFERMSRQFRQIKEEFNHEVVVKLSNQLEEISQYFIRMAEQNGEQVYEFLHKNLRYFKLNKAVDSVRDVIVRMKEQIKQVKVHENLHKFFNYQPNFDLKWDLKNGEIKGQVDFNQIVKFI